MRNRVINKIITNTIITLIIAQIAVIIVPWIIDAIMPDMRLQSLLSGSGLRWMIGQSANHLFHPMLSWLLMVACALGVFCKSDLYATLRNLIGRKEHFTNLSYKRKFALYMSLILLLLCVSVVIIILFLPGAILQNVSGKLTTDVLLRVSCPVICFVIVIVSATYGIFCGTFSKGEKIYLSLVWGLRQVLPYLILYMFCAELWASIRFVSMHVL